MDDIPQFTVVSRDLDLTDEDTTLICQLLEERVKAQKVVRDLSNYRIAEKFGCSASDIERIRKRFVA